MYLKELSHVKITENECSSSSKINWIPTKVSNVVFQFKRALLSLTQLWSGRMQKIRCTLKSQRTFSVAYWGGSVCICIEECGEKIWNAAPLVNRLEIKIQTLPQHAFYINILILGISVIADCQSHCFIGNRALFLELFRRRVWIPDKMQESLGRSGLRVEDSVWKDG